MLLILVGCGAASGANVPAPPTPTAVAVPYVPPAAAQTAQAIFALTPHPTATATVVPTATPQGAAVTFAAVQQILTDNCVGCHPPQQGMDLTVDHAYANIVNVASHEVPSRERVKPGDPANSYLYQKITEQQPAVGARMPRSAPPLSADEIATIRAWIQQGAKSS